ncbi:redoxin domain-containing protein [Nonomuraea dietziae]|uniref:redoxin domain-containing protein n=1 Tax=Nonomuraea dietziae TaxID=65515 RepID=UPI0033E7393E
MITVRAAAVLTATALLVTACGAMAPGDAAAPMRDDAPPSAASASTSPSTPAASDAPVATAAVPSALDFSATTLKGQRFDGASLAGKPVVFWFWAPWCPKCRSEAPAVKSAAATYDQVAFVGVAGLDTEAAMREFVQRTGTGDVTHLADAKGAVWTRLGVSEQSTFVFMKPDGSTTKATGPLSQGDLDGHVQRLLGR